jgi:hypothetical protein
MKGILMVPVGLTVKVGFVNGSFSPDSSGNPFPFF